MKVWIVNPFDNLPSEGNRPQRYWLMSEAFAKAGHQVVYWTSDFSHATKSKRVEISAGGARDDLKVIQLPTLPYLKNVSWARVRSHRQLAREFERQARILSVDLVIASTPPLGLCESAMRLAHSKGAKFVCDIQDAWPETFARLLPSGFKWLRWLLFAPMYMTARRIYREADMVTGVCAKYAVLSGRKDFYLAYHGIADSDHLFTRHHGRHHLVYAGNLGEGYDLETVFEALTKRNELTLDIAGAGPRAVPLRERVQMLGLCERVRFHGYLGAEALKTLLKSCDIGVIPMRDDSWVGLPYKLCDYLMNGLKVISSLNGECGELLRRTGFGAVYAYGSANDLLRAIDSLTATEVTLPSELRADHIYPQYVQHVGGQP